MKLPMKKKTTADVPPSVAAEYKKAPRGQAVAEATGDGYTDTRKMKKGKMAEQGPVRPAAVAGRQAPYSRHTGRRDVACRTAVPASSGWLVRARRR